MFRLMHYRPSPAMVVACTALLISLGGVSYAAVTLPANSVGTRQVINGSLLKNDFKSGQLPRGRRGVPGDRGPAGATGAAGAAGPAGPAGASGPGGVTKVTTVDGPAVGMCPSGAGDCQTAVSTAICPSGSFVVGGGWQSSSNDTVVESARATTATSYLVIAINYAATTGTISAHAICASGPGLSAG
jgi:hypothetical protein